MKKIEVFIFRGKEYETKKRAHRAREAYLNTRMSLHYLTSSTPRLLTGETLLNYEHLLEEKITKETCFVTKSGRRFKNYKDAVHHELFWFIMRSNTVIAGDTVEDLSEYIIENKDQIIKILGDQVCGY